MVERLAWLSGALLAVALFGWLVRMVWALTVDVALHLAVAVVRLVAWWVERGRTSTAGDEGP